MTTTESTETWWGSYEISPAEARRWRIGPLELVAWWRDPEWRVMYDRNKDLVDGGVEVAAPADPETTETAEVLRVMSAAAGGRVALSPVCADRPVVVRPETAVLVLPGARVRLFVSTPVWVRVEVGEPARQVLDVASWRLSDTWFGPSPRQGELCYAVRTSARLNIENLPVLGHRALSEVSVENRTKESFSLERFKLPAPNLSLHADAEAHLWTPTVTVLLREQDALAEVDLGTGPPASAREPQLVTGARAALSRNILERAMGGLFL